jgi:hypothetical protein
MNDSILCHRNDRRRSFTKAILLGLVLASAVAWPATGANRYWVGNGIGSNWSEPNNWNPSSPPQDGDTLIFGNLASQRNNNNNLANLRVHSIQFSSSGYTLRGNPILLNSDITAAHASGFNNVRFGVQCLNGGATFSVINAGQLEVSGDVTLANRQQLIIFALGTNVTISGAIVGDGDLLKLGIISSPAPGPTITAARHGSRTARFTSGKLLALAPFRPRSRSAKIRWPHAFWRI